MANTIRISILRVSILIGCCLLPALLLAQDPPEVTFTSDVVAKNTKAVNYRHRMGSTKVDFKGTSLMPAAEGRASVESKAGRIEIDLDIRNLDAANKFGNEYLTYVLWAITPEGRPQNLGEILLKNGKGDLKVTTELQAFGLVITAEPYFAVTMPSDLIVAENELRTDTLGRTEVVDARYELLQRGRYAKMTNPLGMALDPKTPLELYQARNALLIAKSAKADKYAADVLEKAEASLKQAEEYHARGNAAKPAAMMARDAVQRAEDARAISVRREEEERLEKERADAAARESAAKEAANRQAQLRAQAEEQQRQTEIARRREEERRMAAELEKARAEAASLRAQAEKEAEERRRIEAELAAEKLRQERTAAEDARQRAMQQEEAARREAEASRKLAEQAEQEKVLLRQRLFEQFSQVLETRDTERGLIVNMGDLLFDIGKATLRQDAREKLAKLSGLVLGHSGLRLEAEGHTDATGSDALNQRLSEERAEVVRAYLESQGISPDNLSARGYGKTMPIADNTTSKGRQANRRVEIIVSGEIIGRKLGAVATSSPTPLPN
ncbi:MAG: OmpA family protein [Bryobacter sp.]|nr:OmpA family protein [Bryobacter sp.]